MIEIFKNTLYGFALGVSFAAAGWTFLDWQFWPATIIIIILVEWKAWK